MRRITHITIAASAAALLVFACGGNTSTPTTPNAAVAPTAGTDPYGYYTQPGQPGYAQPGYTQPGYTQPTQPGYTPAAPATAQPTAPAAAQMATPGPLALPCQNDSACILARCNMQYQKCAFPCQSAADCAQGAACNPQSGLCLPGGP